MDARKIDDEFTPLRRLCEEAVAAGVVPGGVVLCANGATTRFYEAFGARETQPFRRPATTDTVYDVASITKAVVTSVLLMRALADGVLRLDAPVNHYLPEFLGDGKRDVTARHLLCHASGLPAYRPFYRAVMDDDDCGALSARSRIELAAAREPLVGKPGAVSVYSDLGFILLGWILERLTGVGLDTQAARAIFAPLGLTSTAFVNLLVGPRTPFAAQPVAPTELCPVRGRLVSGEVHDLNAFAMGGVAGHAGLFSDAAGLGKIAAALWSAWRGEKGGLVAPEIIREFWRPSGVAASTWRLGWDGPAAQNSQAGALISRGAVGHLGFTGCSLWIDPERALWVVLLTNRVHPVVREDPRFRIFRATVHDAAVGALTEPSS